MDLRLEVPVGIDLLQLLKVGFQWVNLNVPNQPRGSSTQDRKFCKELVRQRVTKCTNELESDRKEWIEKTLTNSSTEKYLP